MKNTIKALMIVLVAVIGFSFASCGDGAGGDEGPPADGSGAGTPENPFIVASVESLAKVGTNSDGWGVYACYKQTEDITLDGL